MARIFSDENLKAYTDEIVGLIPDGKRGALVGYYTLSGKWKVVGLSRVNDTWQIGAVLEGDMATQNIKGTISVLAVW